MTRARLDQFSREGNRVLSIFALPRTIEGKSQISFQKVVAIGVGFEFRDDNERHLFRSRHDWN